MKKVLTILTQPEIEQAIYEYVVRNRHIPKDKPVQCDHYLTNTDKGVAGRIEVYIEVSE